MSIIFILISGDDWFINNKLNKFESFSVRLTDGTLDSEGDLENDEVYALHEQAILLRRNGSNSYFVDYATNKATFHFEEKNEKGKVELLKVPCAGVISSNYFSKFDSNESEWKVDFRHKNKTFVIKLYPGVKPMECMYHHGCNYTCIASKYTTNTIFPHKNRKPNYLLISFTRKLVG